LVAFASWSFFTWALSRGGRFRILGAFVESIDGAVVSIVKVMLIALKFV
jgi:hypothetical protein